MKISGIYKIQSKIKPNRIYIGSAVDIGDRWRCHLKGLRNNKHHSQKLQRHYNKYGEVDLQFSILLSCEKADLIRTEQYFIDSYNPYFNNAKIAGSTLGYKHSIETCKKNSEARRGKKLSEEHKKNISLHSSHHKSNLGKKASFESRKKMSISQKGLNTWSKGKPSWNKGIPSTRERCKNCGFFISGHKEHVCKEMSVLTRQQMSKSHMGEKNHFYGKHHSAESNKKNSDAAKKRWGLLKLNKSA